MKPVVTFFLGSPRKRGNTARVIEKVREQLKGKGVKSEAVFLPDHDIAPCRECFKCQKVSDAPGCAIKDGMQAMFDRIFESEAIVLAAPVFCWSFAAQIKPFIDRMFCLGKYGADPMITLVKDKKCALIVTAGGDEFDGADLMISGFNKMTDFFQMQNMGHLVIAEYTDNKMLEKSGVKEKIASFADKISV